MMVCPKFDYPRFAHVFQKKGDKMSDLVIKHCWDPSWNNKNKIVYTDSRYCTMDLIKELHHRGTALVSTMSAESASKGKKRSRSDLAAEQAKQAAAEAAMTEQERGRVKRQRLKAVCLSRR